MKPVPGRHAWARSLPQCQINRSAAHLGLRPFAAPGHFRPRDQALKRPVCTRALTVCSSTGGQRPS